MRFGHLKGRCGRKRKSPDVGCVETSSFFLEPEKIISPGSRKNDCDDCNTGLAGVQEVLREKFVPKRAYAEVLSEVYGSIAECEPGFMPGIMDGRAARVFDCGTYLEFRGESMDSQFRLHHANFCHDRFCPMCNWRRSLKMFSQVSAVMDKLESSGYMYLMLTLTVRNCEPDELSETITMMQDGWRNLYHKCPAFRQGRGSRVIQGGVKVLEVTRNMNPGSEWYGTFHPHYHLILAVKMDYFTGPDYIHHDQWVQIWKSACGLNYDPSVFVEVVRSKCDSEGHVSMGAAVAEVAKYAFKDSDYLSGSSIEDNREILMQLLSGLTGRRLYSFFGCFFKVRQELKLDDPEDGDLVNVDGQQLRNDVYQIIVRCRWRAGFYDIWQTDTDAEQCDRDRAQALEDKALDMRNEYFKW